MKLVKATLVIILLLFAMLHAGCGKQPAIDIEKWTNGQDADAAPGPTIPVGDTITWTYTVTNIGKTTISNITVTDSMEPAPSYVDGDDGNGILDIGEKWNYRATGVASEGMYENKGMVQGWYNKTMVEDSDFSHYVGGSYPSIDIEKATNGQDADDPTGAIPQLVPGSDVKWTYRIENTGNVKLISVNVADDEGVTPLLIDDGNGDSTLDVDEVWIYEANGKAVAGLYSNTGSVQAWYSGTKYTDSDLSHYFGKIVSIDLEKLVNGQDADTPQSGPAVALGSTVSFDFVVVNTGNVTLTNVVVTDNVLGAIGTIVSLAPGASQTLTKTAAAATGQHANTATVTSTQGAGDTDAGNYFGMAPSYTIDKTVTEVSVAAPGTLHYTVVLTNTGNIPLSVIILKDSIVASPGAAVESVTADGLLNVGEYWTWTYTYGVSQGQIDAGASIVNTATADCAELGQIQDSCTVPVAQGKKVDLEKLVNGQDADTPQSGPAVALGSTVTFDFVVANTGNVTLTNVVVTDNVLGAIGTIASLAPGASQTLTKTAAAATGQHANTATVTCTQGAGDTDPGNYFGMAPSYTIDKTVTEVSIAAPGTLHYTVVLTNTGNVTLSSVTLQDSLVALPGKAVESGTVDGILNVGEHWTWAYTYAVSQGQIDAGADILNTATADCAELGPIQDSCAVPIAQGKKVDLEKLVNGQDADTPESGPTVAAGSTVSFNFVVANTGNVTLTNVIVSDSALGLIGTIPSLAPGGRQTFTRTAAAEIGQHTNTGTVSSTQGAGDTDLGNYFGAAPAYTIDKTVAEASIAAPGNLNYTVVLTNAGNIPLSVITLLDSLVASTGAPVESGTVDGLLNVGEHWTWTYAYFVSQGQIDAGTNILNTATADCAELGPVQDSCSVLIAQSKKVDLEKLVNGLDADTQESGPSVALGSTVSFDFIVANTGNVTLTNLSVADSILGPVGTITSLAPGASQSLNRTAIAASGQHTNTGSVSSSQGAGDTDLGNYFGEAPAYTIDKTVAEASIASPGNLHYTVVLTNTGNIPLRGIILQDSNVASPGSPVESGTADGQLNVGEHWTWTYTYFVSQGQIDAGANILNTATADCAELGPIQDVCTVSIVQNKSVDIEKLVNGLDADTPVSGPSVAVGSIVSFDFVVTNTGSITLTNLAVADSVLGTIGTIPSLAPGGSQTLNRTATAAAGQHTNTGTVTSVQGAGDTDLGNYFGAAPAYTIDKAVAEASMASPGTLHFTVVLTNTGNIPLSGITLQDRLVASAGTPVESGIVDGLLNVGEHWTWTYTYAIDQGHIDAGTDIVNTATASCAELDPIQDGCTVTIVQNKKVDLEKLVNGQDADTPASGPAVEVGASVTFDFTVTNTGNVTLTNAIVTDDLLGTIGTIPSLAPGGSQTLTTSAPAAAGQHANTGTVTATPPSGPDISDTDLGYYFGSLPGLEIKKLVNGSDADTSATGPVVETGSTVTFKFIVTNTGIDTLTNITINDNVLGSIGTVDVLAKDEFREFTLEVPAVQGSHANVATAVGTPPVGDDVVDTDPGHYFGSTPGIDLKKRVNGLDADTAESGPFVSLPSVVTYSFIVTNTGNVALTDVLITDDVLGNIATVATLSAGSSQTFTKTASAVAGLNSNIGTVSGKPPVGANVTDTDPAHYFGSQPGLLLKKTVNGNAADSPLEGLLVLSGSTLEFGFTVENTGNVTLTDLTVDDDVLGRIGTIVSLIPGASQTLSASDTAASGPHMNTGTATGKPPVGAVISDTDPAHYFGVSSGIELKKRVNGVDADTPISAPVVPIGSTVNYSYEVRNTGNVDLTGVTVFDDILGNIGPIGNLAAGASQTLTKTEAASEGAHSNTGTATGTPPIGSNVSDTDLGHYFGSLPGIELKLKVNDQDADIPESGPIVPIGTTVTYSYIATNTGNVTLTGVMVSDSAFGNIGTVGSLAPGESKTLTKLTTATPGSHANVGTVTGVNTEGGNVSDTDPGHYFGSDPGIDLKKKVNGVDADTPATGPVLEVGTTVTFSFEVQNTGNITLTDVAVTDNVLGTIGTIPSLQPGASEILQIVETASIGSHTNIATASGNPPVGDSVTEIDMGNYFGASPRIELRKKVNGADADTLETAPFIAVNGIVTYSYMVINLGNVALTDVTVTDDILGMIGTIPSLAAGDSQTLVTTSIASAGAQTNIGTVVGTPPVGGNISDTDAGNYFGSITGINLKKMVNGVDADTPAAAPFVPVGTPVSYSFIITNTGNVPLANVTVTDNILGSIGSLPTLAAGAEHTFTATADALTGAHANIATAVGDPPVGADVSDTDPGNYFGSAPAIELKKRVNGIDADTPASGPVVIVGSTVEYSFVVTNKGNVALTSISVVDDVLGEIGSIAALNPGGNLTLTKSATATSGSHANIGTARGTPPVGPDVSDTDPGNYLGSVPGLELKKLVNGMDADTPETAVIVQIGSLVTYTFVVTNTGNVTLTGITVNDDVLGYIGSISSLAAGSNQTLTDTAYATSGAHANIATASGTSPAGENPSDTDPGNYFGSSPAIELKKKVNDLDADTPATGPLVLTGSTVTYSFIVTNKGNIALSNVVVTDSVLGSIGTLSSLAAGGTHTFTTTATALQGPHSNIGSVKGTPPVGVDVTDTDPGNYFGATPGIEIKKRVNGLDADTPQTGPKVVVGTTVIYSFIVTNMGNVPLSNLHVTDDVLGNIGDIASLAPGASQTLTSNVTAALGAHANIATVIGTPTIGPDVSDSDPGYYFGSDAAIELKKKVNGFDADTSSAGPTVAVGSTVNYSFLVTNIGNVELTGITVTDDVLGSIGTISSLASGASQTLTKTATALAGYHLNTGTVTGTPPVGDNVSDSDPGYYYGTSIKTWSYDFTTATDIIADGWITGAGAESSFILSRNKEIQVDWLPKLPGIQPDSEFWLSGSGLLLSDMIAWSPVAFSGDLNIRIVFDLFTSTNPRVDFECDIMDSKSWSASNSISNYFSLIGDGEYESWGVWDYGSNKRTMYYDYGPGGVPGLNRSGENVMTIKKVGTRYTISINDVVISDFTITYSFGTKYYLGLYSYLMGGGLIYFKQVYVEYGGSMVP